MIPSLETDRLWLKGVTLDHIPYFYKYFVDYDVVEFLNANVPWPYPNGAAETFLSRVLANQGKTEWLWGLFLKSEPNEMIGAVHLFKTENSENRGFWLGKKFWNQGLMTEAVFAVNDYAFDVVGFEKLNLANAKANTQSGKIKQKTGAVFVGIEKSRYVNPNITEQEKWI